MDYGCKLFTKEQQDIFINSLKESAKLRKEKPPDWRQLRDFFSWAEVRVIAALALGLVVNGQVRVAWNGKSGEFKLLEKGELDYNLLWKDFLEN